MPRWSGISPNSALSPATVSRRKRGSGRAQSRVHASVRARHAQGQEDRGGARRQRGVSGGDFHLVRGDRQALRDWRGSGRCGEGRRSKPFSKAIGRRSATEKIAETVHCTELDRQGVPVDRHASLLHDQDLFIRPSSAKNHRNLQLRYIQSDEKFAMLLHGSRSLSLGLALANPEQPPILAYRGPAALSTRRTYGPSVVQGPTTSDEEVVVSEGIQRVGVIGAGTMGNGIAQTFAVAGFPVVMRDLNQLALDRGLKAKRKPGPSCCEEKSSRRRIESRPRTDSARRPT